MAPPSVSTFARYRSVLISIRSPAIAGGLVPPGTAALGVAATSAGFPGDGTAASLLDLLTACGGTGGRCSACQRSHRKSAEKEKIAKRISLWVSMSESPRQAGL